MINVFLPQTAEDITSRADDITRLATVARGGVPPEPDFIPWLAENPHVLYLFYLDDAPMAFIRLDDRGVDPELGKNTVQIHGGILPEYRGMADEPSLFVLKAAFKVKKNVIAKIDPENLGTVGWVRKWGFKKINREHGLDVYRLKRSEFMRAQA